MLLKKHCCKFAALAAIAAVLLVSLLRGYDILDWALLSWLGAAIVVVAAWFCMKCRDFADEKDDIEP